MIHHLGQIVTDLTAARARYRALGFLTAAATGPAMAPRPGASPEPFGVLNTHADLRRSFLEIAAPVEPGGPAEPGDTALVPLDPPPDRRDELVARIQTTVERLTALRRRSPGWAVLMFSVPAVDPVADHLSGAGVAHDGVATVTREVSTPEGRRTETIRYLEIDDAGATPEGRVGFVEDLDPGLQATRRQAHPNGALDVVGAVICAPDPASVRARYTSYLGDPRGAGVVVVGPSELGRLLPGEQAPAEPAIVACRVLVEDLARIPELLLATGAGVRPTPAGDLLLPARSGTGAAIVLTDSAG